MNIYTKNLEYDPGQRLWRGLCGCGWQDTGWYRLRRAATQKLMAHSEIHQDRRDPPLFTRDNTAAQVGL